MATIFKTDGTIEEVTIKKTGSLKQMQTIVGGLIEIVATFDGKCLIVNEEGKLNDLPLNKNATLLYEIGKPPIKAHEGRIYFQDVIQGDAIYCTKEEAGYK